MEAELLSNYAARDPLLLTRGGQNRKWPRCYMVAVTSDKRRGGHKKGRGVIKLCCMGQVTSDQMWKAKVLLNSVPRDSLLQGEDKDGEGAIKSAARGPLRLTRRGNEEVTNVRVIKVCSKGPVTSDQRETRRKRAKVLLILHHGTRYS